MALENTDYTVAWILALPDERASAEALLDEEHDDLPSQEGDSNAYTLGKMGRHNVVIAGLGSYGTTSAAIVAANLLRSFPNIRFGLLVGVGGGVPDPNDLRLGDVVVSIPEGINGGVIQYDFGTAVQDKKFVRKGSLNKPPTILTNALGKLRSKAAREGYTCWRHYDQMLERNPKMKPRFSRPERDELYEADYIHEGGKVDCVGCSLERAVERPERIEREPSIFYGTIGSANQVLRDAQVRDELHRQTGIICFEMEAAGLMDNFPCMVIRGICDYADTHKNKDWQPYAGAIAAAFAKELVLSVAPSSIGTLPQANLVLRQMGKRQDLQAEHLRNIEAKTDLAKLHSVKGAAYNSFSDTGEENSQCLPGTRLDLLDQMRQWATASSKSVFWLNGAAGTGKSTIARTIAAEFDAKRQLGASFFFKSGQGDRGRALSFVTTIVNQLVQSIPELRLLVRNVLNDNPGIIDQALQPQFEQLIIQPLQEITNSVDSSYLMVVDALDECENEGHIKSIVKLLSQIQSAKVRVKTIITSRPELPIKLGFRTIPKDTYQDFILQEIEKSVIEHDIALFFRYRFEQIRIEWSEPSPSILPTEWPGENNIKTLTAMAIPLFIFAATVCRFIGDSFNNPEESLDLVLKYRSKTSLDQMDQTYKPILDRILDASIKRSESQQVPVIEKFRNILGPIVVLADYLSINSLANLLQMKPSDIFTLLRHLHSVLENVDHLDRPIRPFHLSFSNYLLDPGRENQFWIDETAMHKYMAYKCIYLLRRSEILKQDICDLKKPGFLRSDIDQSTLSRCIPAELQYACCYWVQHLEKGRCKIKYQEEFHLFLNERFLWWLEVLSLIGRVSTAIDMMSTLQTLVDEPDSSNLVDFLLDAQRFILMNCFIADTAPLQLYCSSLVFAPQHSFIRNRYSLPKWLTRCPFAEETWSGVLQTLEGHSNEVTSVAYSPDGKQLATCSHDKTIKIWDAKTGFLQRTLEGHSNEVHSAIYSPDGRRLFSCSLDRTVRIWDADTGSSIDTIHIDGVVRWIAFSPDGKQLACACSSEKTRILNADTGSEQQVLEGLQGSISSVAFSPNGKLLAISSSMRDIGIWDTNTEILRIAEMDQQNIKVVSFSPDGKLLITGSYRTIKVWNVETESIQQTFEAHENVIESVAFSPDGKMLATACWGRQVKLWSVETWSLQSTQTHPKQVKSVAFSPDGKRLASACADNKVRIWDVNSPQEMLKEHSNSVVSLRFSHDGKHLVSYSKDTTVKIWNASTESLEHTLEGELKGIGCIAFSASEKLLAYCCSSTTIKIWDVGKGTLKQITGIFQFINSIALSPDGKQLACCLNNHTVHVCDISTGSWGDTIESESDWAKMISISSDEFNYQNLIKESRIFRGTNGVCIKGDWIMRGNEKLIWIPPKYRTKATAAVGSIYALGLASGQVMFFEFSFDEADVNDNTDKSIQ